MEGRLSKYFFQEICFSGGKQTIHKVSAAFIVKNCHPRTSLKPPPTYRLQIFLAKDQYLRSLLPHGDQAIAGQLEKHVLKPMLAILTTYMETRLER